MNKDYVTRNEFNTQIAKVERTEVIYDMTNDDVEINKNSKGGIVGGTWGAFEIDTKYKGVKVYAILNGKTACIYCDLSLLKKGLITETTLTGLVKNQNTSGNNTYIFYGINITITSTLSFIVRECFSFNVSTNTYAQYQDDANYYVYKVEGVY